METPRGSKVSEGRNAEPNAVKGLVRSLSRRAFHRLPDGQQVAVAKILSGNHRPLPGFGEHGLTSMLPGVARLGRLVPQEGFDSHHQAMDNVSVVREVLERSGIEFVTLPTLDELDPALVVRATFAAALKTSLKTLRS